MNDHFSFGEGTTSLQNRLVGIKLLAEKYSEASSKYLLKYYPNSSENSV